MEYLLDLKNSPKEADNDAYRWLIQNPRHKELAFDPDKGKFIVDEAQAIIEAEKQGLIKSPVKRGIFDDGSTRGADYIDANGIEWDIKKADGGAEKIVGTLKGGENVIVDARGMNEADFRIIKAEIEAKRPKNDNQVRYVR